MKCISGRIIKSTTSRIRCIDQRRHRVTWLTRFWPKDDKSAINKSGDKSRVNYRIKHSHVYGFFKHFRNLSGDLGLASISTSTLKTTSCYRDRLLASYICLLLASRFSPAMTTTISFTILTNPFNEHIFCAICCILCLWESRDISSSSWQVLVP